MNINLREEATSQYILFYQGFLEEVQTINRKVTDVLNEVMQQSKYDKLQRSISEIIDAYAEMITNSIEGGVFSTWQESKGSLRACLRIYRAGDAADEVCAQIEHQMGDLMQDILRIEKANLVITERPIVSEEGLVQLEDICCTAQTEIQNLKVEYISQVSDQESGNDIYGTLRPLIEGVVSNMEIFFEASLNSFLELHAFVSGISGQFHNLAEGQGIDSSANNAIDKKMKGELAAIASAMRSKNGASSIDKFKEITSVLYKSICDDVSFKKKKIPYHTISEIMPIYHKFYSNYGQLLKDKFKNSKEREDFVKREYVSVTRERNNDQFFDGEEVWTFKSHAHRTYTVFNRVADMEKNIANACKNGNANDINLMYGAYVLFTPIIEGYIAPEDSKKYSKFSKWASDKILDLLGEECVDKDPSQTSQDEDISFEGENFSNANIKLFVKVLELMVNQVGVDELNSLVKKHHPTLISSRNIYSRKVVKGVVSTHNITENKYGRYIVTNKSIQAIAPLYSEVESILEPIDKFYKEKFESLDKGFQKANTTIHAISSFCGLWGLGTFNLSKIIFNTDSNSTILEKVQLGGIALTSCTKAGIIINGGILMLKIMDWVMPYVKKSKILVKLSEKVWNLTRQDIQIPYMHKMMDQYMMEHYELKYGMSKGQSGYFTYYHNVATSLEDNHERHAFEYAIFAAETLLTTQNYIINQMEPQQRKAICYGIFLNLVRAGMCSEQDIESRTSNDIVDKLYNIYASEEDIIPRVDISPDRKVIG